MGQEKYQEMFQMFRKTIQNTDTKERQYLLIMTVVMTNMINEDDDEDYKDWCYDAFEKSRLLPPVLAASTNLFCLHNYVPASLFFSSVFLCY